MHICTIPKSNRVTGVGLKDIKFSKIASLRQKKKKKKKCESSCFCLCLLFRNDRYEFLFVPWQMFALIDGKLSVNKLSQREKNRKRERERERERVASFSKRRSLRLLVRDAKLTRVAASAWQP